MNTRIIALLACAFMAQEVVGQASEQCKSTKHDKSKNINDVMPHLIPKIEVNKIYYRFYRGWDFFDKEKRTIQLRICVPEGYKLEKTDYKGNWMPVVMGAFVGRSGKDDNGEWKNVSYKWGYSSSYPEHAEDTFDGSDVRVQLGYLVDGKKVRYSKVPEVDRKRTGSVRLFPRKYRMTKIKEGDHLVFRTIVGCCNIEITRIDKDENGKLIHTRIRTIPDSNVNFWRIVREIVNKED